MASGEEMGVGWMTKEGHVDGYWEWEMDARGMMYYIGTHFQDYGYYAIYQPHMGLFLVFGS